MIRLKKIIKTASLIQAVFLNIVIFFLINLVFEPTPKSDDYDMVMILYGAYTGEYTPYMLYSNIIMGKVIQGLLTIFPSVSWYYVLLSGGILLSLITVIYIYTKKSNSLEWMITSVPFLLLAGYELYIRITFTKVSGVLISAGFLWLLYLIDKNSRFSIKYIWGIILIIYGVLIRGPMFEVIVAVFFSSFILYILQAFRRKDKKAIKGVMYFVFLVILLWMVTEALGKTSSHLRSMNEEWKYYSEVNGKRSALIDYGWPDYNTYLEEYERLGISENDVLLWKNCAVINDTEILTPTLLEQIRSIAPTQADKKISEIIDSSSKKMISYYLDDTGIFFFLIGCIFLVLQKKKSGLIPIIGVGGCCLFSYYYMSYMGRLQHHVDVVVMIAGAFLLLYYCFPSEVKRKTQLQLCISMGFVFIIFIQRFYINISNSSYYTEELGKPGKSQIENYKKNKDLLELFSEDENHLYNFLAYETNWTYDAAWNIFEVVTPDFYHNLYTTNRYAIPPTDQILSNYSIKNVYKEAIDSDVVYYVSTDRLREHMDILCQYLKEHYNENTYYTIVKQIDDVNVYRFNAGEIKPSWKESDIINEADIISDVQINHNDDGTITVSGYAFLEDIDSFSQNIYIEAVDKITGESIYTYGVQKENDLFVEKDKYHGRYSSFSGTVEPNNLDECSLYLYIDIGADVYKLDLED